MRCLHSRWVPLELLVLPLLLFCLSLPELLWLMGVRVLQPLLNVPHRHLDFHHHLLCGTERSRSLPLLLRWLQGLRVSSLSAPRTQACRGPLQRAQATRP